MIPNNVSGAPVVEVAGGGSAIYRDVIHLTPISSGGCAIYRDVIHLAPISNGGCAIYRGGVRLSSARASLSCEARPDTSPV